MDEQQLIRAADSNFAAFAELYRLSLTRVFRYHMAHVADVNTAEELTSQTFLEALKELPALQSKDSFAVRVLQIAVEQCRKDQRANRRVLPNDATLYYQVSSPASDKAARQRKELESVTRALKQIASLRAEAIILYFFSELSTTEISTVLKKNAETIGTLVTNGLEDLRTRTSLASGREIATSDMEDEELINKLSNLAARLTPDSLFESDLEEALATAYRPKIKHTLTLPLPQISATLGWIVLTGLTFFLLYWRETPNTPPTRPATARPSKQATTKIAASKTTSTPRRPTAIPSTTDIPLQDYIVQAGDTCTYIAKKFGVTIASLITINHLNSTCDIWAEQKLKVPLTP